MVDVSSSLFHAESWEIPVRKTKHRASFWEERENQQVDPLDLVISFLLGVLLGFLEFHVLQMWHG